MKTSFIKVILVLLPFAFSLVPAFGQSPEKMSYQAVIRNNSDALVTNTQIGMEINIRQGSPTGTVVYTETQTPTTNANGLVSIEIGGGTGFNTINWGTNTYFIETKTAVVPPLTTYTITGTSQLLSVPYALHSKTAETVTGGITETDPAVAANFDFTDAVNGDLLQFNGTKWVKVTPTYISDYTVTQADVTAHQAALTVTESQISDLGTYIETETDPAVTANFDFTDAVNGDLLQFNGTKWVKVTPTYISDYTVTQADVTAHQAALTVTESQISDLGTYIETETDPAVTANFDFTDAVNGDLLQFNGTKWVKVTPTYISDYTVTQADVTAHQAALTVTESQISDLGTYIETETDPAVTANFDFTDAANGDLLQFNGTKWVKVTPTYISDYTVTQADVTAHQAALTVTESQISDLGTYIETETDPAVTANFDFTDAANGDLLQFNGTKWVKVTPTYISDYTVTQADVTAHQAALTVTESQISDLGTYIETETDPAVTANFDFTDAANGDLLQFNGTKWVKVTPTYISDYTVTQADVTAHQAALTLTESQISDLGTYIETETDPAVAANFDFTDAANGDLLQFNGTKWVKVTPNYAAGNHTHTTATIEVDGFMSSADKIKVENLSGTNTGDNAVNSLYSSLVTNATHTGDVTGSGALTIANKKTMTATAPISVSGSPTVIATSPVAISIAAATTSAAGSMSAADKTKLNSLAVGTAAGQMQYWNGTNWVTVAPGLNGQILRYKNGVPTWTDGNINDLSIGDSYQGGIIAYFLKPGDPEYDPNVRHGLIAAKVDQSLSILWHNGSGVSTGATGTALGTGSANTTTIINVQGETYTNYAAGIARAYNGGGYSDWYLPSINELEMIYLNKDQIGGFGGVRYWSSSEASQAAAGLINFSNGTVSPAVNKGLSFVSVRAIRSF